MQDGRREGARLVSVVVGGVLQVFVCSRPEPPVSDRPVLDGARRGSGRGVRGQHLSFRFDAVVRPVGTGTR